LRHRTSANAVEAFGVDAQRDAALEVGDTTHLHLLPLGLPLNLRRDTVRVSAVGGGSMKVRAGRRTRIGAIGGRGQCRCRGADSIAPSACPGCIFAFRARERSFSGLR
jgi:hypothetical protein